MSTPLDRPSTPPPSPPTPTLPPSYPSSPNQNDRDPVNPPGLLRFRPAHIRTPATSPMRAGAAAYAQAAWRGVTVGEVEVEEEAGGEKGGVEAKPVEGPGVDVRSVGVEGDVDVEVGVEFDVQEAGMNLELNTVPGEHDANPSMSPNPPSDLLRGRRYTVALINEGSRASAWRPPRPRTPVPSPVRRFEEGSEEDGGDGDDKAEIGIEVEGASEDEGTCEDEGDDEGEGENGIGGTFGLSSVHELVPLLRTLNAEHPFGAGAVPQLVDLVWPAGSSAEESSGDEEGVFGDEASGDEEELREGENELGRIAEEEGPVNGADDGEFMVSQGESDDPHSELRGDGEGEGASGREDRLFQGEPIEGEGQVALVGSHTYFLHLPLADRPRGGAQIQRLGWWVSL